VALVAVTRSAPVRRRPGRLNRIRVTVLAATIVGLAVHMFGWYYLDWRTVGKLSFSGFASLMVGHVNMAAIFCAGLLLSLLLAGRLFCGWACKLSALQDATEWIYRRIGFKPEFLHTRARMVRVFIWVPYLLPVLYVWQEVGLSTAYINAGAVEPWTADLPKTVLASVFYFVSITFVLTALFGRRAFCRLLCMFSMFFRLFDALPWVPRIRQRARCIGCGVCDRACPMGLEVAGDVLRAGKVCDSECIRCMVCIDVCPVKALSFGVRPLVVPQEPDRRPVVHQSALPVAVDAALATLAVIGGVWAATRISGFHVFLGASWGLIGGLLAWRAAQALARREVTA
jgi:polyferredoxin